MSIIEQPQVYLVGAGPGNPLLLSKKQSDVLSGQMLFYTIN